MMFLLKDVIVAFFKQSLSVAG